MSCINSAQIRATAHLTPNTCRYSFSNYVVTKVVERTSLTAVLLWLPTWAPALERSSKSSVLKQTVTLLVRLLYYAIDLRMLDPNICDIINNKKFDDCINY